MTRAGRGPRKEGRMARRTWMIGGVIGLALALGAAPPASAQLKLGVVDNLTGAAAA